MEIAFRELKIFKTTENSLKTIPIRNYSKSLRLGFLEGSLERRPKINKETKKITVV